MKEFYLKFIKTNSRMIKHIWSCDYLSDETKLRKCAFFTNLNQKLFHDLFSKLT